ncbi:MAG: hypothetical protein U5K75_02390 [Ahrensia sp.]|nr:hypothetical protein [Ahrensia sp.]
MAVDAVAFVFDNLSGLKATAPLLNPNIKTSRLPKTTHFGDIVYWVQRIPNLIPCLGRSTRLFEQEGQRARSVDFNTIGGFDPVTGIMDVC